MPLHEVIHFQNPDSLLGIWHITESEVFFNSTYTQDLEKIKNSKIRIQKKVSRFILPHLVDNIPLHLLTYSNKGKPFFKDSSYNISISHSDKFVTVFLSAKWNVGIDIQIISNKCLRVLKKYLSNEEALCVMNSPNPLFLSSLFWSAKECVFKMVKNSNHSLKNIFISTHLEILQKRELELFYCNKKYTIHWKFIHKEYILCWSICPF